MVILEARDYIMWLRMERSHLTVVPPISATFFWTFKKKMKPTRELEPSELFFVLTTDVSGNVLLAVKKGWGEATEQKQKLVLSSRLY